MSHQVVEAADDLPLLEVGLSIQCGRLDVAEAVRVTGAQQQHVGREDLVTSQPDEVSHPNLLPVLLHIASLRSARTTRGQTAGVRDAQLLFSIIGGSINRNVSSTSINLYGTANVSREDSLFVDAETKPTSKFCLAQTYLSRDPDKERHIWHYLPN